MSRISSPLKMGLPCPLLRPRCRLVLNLGLMSYALRGTLERVRETDSKTTVACTSL